MYAKVQDGAVVAYPYGPSELMRDNPGVSFPAPMPDITLERYGVIPVQPCNPPSFDQIAENCVRVDPQFVDGVLTETWLVSPASDDEVASRIAEAAASVRAQRNQLLAECDWTQLADAPVDAPAWSLYRQALRDITEQPGFPVSVTWPAQP
jgi:hypothetical protein